MSTFNSVANWNILCGKAAPPFGSPEYFKTLHNQAARIEEELEELKFAISLAEGISEGIKNDDENFIYDGIEYLCTTDMLNEQHMEILDAGCDLDVVVAGVNFLSGHNYNEAIQSVMQNNDLKYTHCLKTAHESKEFHGEGHSVKSMHIGMDSDQADTLEEKEFVTYVTNGLLVAIVHSIHRDSDDKIMKFIDHPKVDLIPFTRTEQ